MNSFLANLNKEFTEIKRNAKLVVIIILFFAFGVMNPAVAKLTPWLLEVMSESMAESGMIVTEVKVDALTSWTQFFKNIPMALIAFVLMFAGIFTKEYEKGTLIPILTKGISRYKIFLSKMIVLFSLWSVGYFLCYLITFVYNDFFWDNSIAENLFFAVFNWWLFGIFVIASVMLFSVIFKSYSSVLLGSGSLVLLGYILGLFPKIKTFIPTSLMNSSSVIYGVEECDIYVKTIIISCLLILAFIASGIQIFNKKQI